MRHCSAFLALSALLVLSGCDRLKNLKSDLAAGDAGAAPITKAGGEVNLTSPPAPRNFELVAVPKAMGSKMFWLAGLGDRVWLSGRGVDAYADGDGPLVKGPDILKTLPYNPQHNVTVIGRYPNLFALRHKQPEGRMGNGEVVFFSYKDEKWVQAPPPKDSSTPPRAFVPWGDGALLVYSQAAGWVTLDASKPGTTFVQLSRDAKLTPIELPVEKTFIAWNAASDGTTLSLVGAPGIAGKQSTDVVVVRGTSGGFTTTPITSGVMVTKTTAESYVAESGTGALLLPPEGQSNDAMVAKAWKPDYQTVTVVGRGAAKTIKPVTNDKCKTREAVLVGDTVFAMRYCNGYETALYRQELSGQPEAVPLPSIVSDPKTKAYRVAQAGEKGARRCDPVTLVVRGKDDLFVGADCGEATYERISKGARSERSFYSDPKVATLPVVFRLGRGQPEPIVLP